jgi:hypothetical protein
MKLERRHFLFSRFMQRVKRNNTVTLDIWIKSVKQPRISVMGIKPQLNSGCSAPMPDIQTSCASQKKLEVYYMICKLKPLLDISAAVCVCVCVC